MCRTVVVSNAGAETRARSRVTLETMTQLVGSGVLVDRALLMAAAVDADAVARPSRYRDAVSRAGRVFWLASQRDLVVQVVDDVVDALSRAAA